MRKVALITGITGQEGSYLAELLLEHNVPYVYLRSKHRTLFCPIAQILSD